MLLGDIFDIVRTDYWFSVPFADRPWNGKIDITNGYNIQMDVNERNYLAAMKGIFTCADGSCAAFFDELNKIADEYKNYYTKLTYIVGNHDRPINLFPSLQNEIKNMFGKFRDVEFIEYVYDENYSVLARHSHEWDSECNGYRLYNLLQKQSKKSIGPEDTAAYQFQSIGEPLTMELMSGIIYNLKLKNAPPDLLSLMMEANNIRPETSVFEWLGWHGSVQNQANRRMIFESLRSALDGMLKTEFAHQWDNLVNDILFRSDITDKLQLLKKFLDVLNYDQISSLVDVVNFFKKHFSSSNDDDLELAKREFNNYKNVQYVVYGHTHEAKNITFETTVKGEVKKYINTGTYLPLIRRISGSNSFETQNQMTMTFLYRKAERGSTYPVCDFWYGTRTEVS